MEYNFWNGSNEEWHEYIDQTWWSQEKPGRAQTLRWPSEGKLVKKDSDVIREEREFKRFNKEKNQKKIFKSKDYI